MSPAAGRTFGPYRLLRSIATDAVSTTWLATSHDGAAPGRQGAAQVMVRIAARTAIHDTGAAELVQQYLAEAQRAGAVDHPAISRPLDLGVIDGHPYVVSPFVGAVPLGEVLARGDALPPPTALAVFAQLAGGIDAAHRADVVHGALSPNTIWIGPSGGRRGASVGYLTGFGSSLLLRQRLAGEPRGDPIDDVLYVAPEQLRGEAVTRASDQYALACALYHALAGRPPFTRQSRAKLYGAHLMTAPPVLRQHDTAIAESTSDALRRAMAKDRAARFASCGVMVNAALPAGEDPPPPSRRSAPRAAATARPHTVTTPPATGVSWPWVFASTVVGIGLLLWWLSAAIR